MMEKKIKVEQQDLEQIKVYSDQQAKPQAQAIPQRTMPYLSVILNTINEELINLDTEVTLMEAILSRG